MKLLLLALLIIGAMCEEESAKHGNQDSKKTKHYESGEHNDDYDHEAILGSEETAEEYAHLSPEEAKKRLSQLYDEMDRNRDGTLENDELVRWIKHSFHKMNKQETDDRMEEFDEDDDDHLSWSEYIQSVHGMSENEIEEYKKSDLDDPEALELFKKNMKHEKDKFNAADEDNDGKLSEDELAAFLHPYDYDRMTKVESDRVMTDYDTNNNGKIELEEYLKSPVFAKKSEEDLVGEKENFKYFDKDGDDALTREEVIEWIAPSIDRISTEEAKHLVEATDADKDGVLSREEVLDQHELWVGSEATSYGDAIYDKDEL